MYICCFGNWISVVSYREAILFQFLKKSVALEVGYHGGGNFEQLAGC